MKRSGLLITAAIGLGCLLPAAHAAWYNVGAENGDVGVANVSFDVNGDGILDTTKDVGLAKIYAQGDGHDLRTVCLDVGNILHSGDYTLADPTGLLGMKPNWGNGVSEENAATALNAAAYLVYAAGLDNSSQAASFKALQLAVWESLYDSPSALSFADGRFTINTVNSVIQGEAQGFLKKLLDAKASPKGVPEMKFQVLVGDADNQELFFGVGDITPAPEPATIFAGALLLLPLGVSTFRILRRQA
jgi:hypothetical protein